MHKEELLTVPFGLGEKNPYGKYFTGTSYLNVLHQEGVLICNVTFEKGCRNFYHIHHSSKNGGQILIATYGRGYYQEENKDPVELLPGDFVYIKPGVKHWHGAAKDSVFSHIAIEVPGENSSTEWLEEVSEENYLKVNEFHKQNKVIQTAGKDQLNEIAPEFARLNDDILFGEVWSREDKLSLRDRSMITISALMAQGLYPQVKAHLILGREHGLKKEEVVEMVTQLAFYCGWPKAWSVFPLIEEVYKDE